MALREPLILRRPRSGRLEGRTALVQFNFNSLTRSKAGIQGAGISVVAPCSIQGQALDPRVRGGDGPF